jgi:hypothetical protein
LKDEKNPKMDELKKIIRSLSKLKDGTRDVSHYCLAIYIKKLCFQAKELKLWKFKYFTCQKYNLQKNPFKETKILQDIITL